MAIRYAVANGNWSSASTWDGGTLPTSADDVFANNFTVVIDQDITVLSLRNAANTSPSITVGGQFQINSGNITVTITVTPLASYFRQLTTNNSPLLLHNNSTGTTTIYCNWNIQSNPGDIMFFRATGSGTINWIGNIVGTVTGQDAAPIRLNSALTFNFIGNLTQQRNAAWSSVASCIAAGINGVTINVTGDLTCSSSSPNSSYCINSLGFATTINVTGNVYNNSIDANTITGGIQGTGNSVITINGNVRGGALPNLNFAVNNTATSTLTINGIIFGGNGSALGFGCAAVDLRGNSTAYLSGPFVYGNYGCTPYNISRVILLNNTSNYTEYASNSTNGALFPSAAPTRFTMYSPNTLADSPIPANVRQGVTYALSSQTGTLIVPSPSNVRKDIPTDNTVGTADLSAADMWNYLTSNITTANTIGKLIKDNLDAQVSTRLASSSYVAPNNSDITAIKAVTDTLTDVATETTALAIKTRTDLIPDNPASNDSVGAIVASYNV